MDRATLKKALDSVALQTYPNIEVVVVNAAGVPHRSLGALCGRYPLRLIETGEVLQRSRAANMALDHAAGDLLLFLDDERLVRSGPYRQAGCSPAGVAGCVGRAHGGRLCKWTRFIVRAGI